MTRFSTPALVMLAALMAVGCGTSKDPKPSSGTEPSGPVTNLPVTDCHAWKSTRRSASSEVLTRGDKANVDGWQDSVCKVVGRDDTYRLTFVPFKASCGMPLSSSVDVPLASVDGYVDQPEFRVTSRETKGGTCLMVATVYEPTAAYFVKTRDPQDINVVYTTQRVSATPADPSSR